MDIGAGMIIAAGLYSLGAASALLAEKLTAERAVRRAMTADEPRTVRRLRQLQAAYDEECLARDELEGRVDVLRTQVATQADEISELKQRLAQREKIAEKIKNAACGGAQVGKYERRNP